MRGIVLGALSVIVSLAAGALGLVFSGLGVLALVQDSYAGIVGSIGWIVIGAAFQPLAFFGVRAGVLRIRGIDDMPTEAELRARAAARPVPPERPHWRSSYKAVAPDRSVTAEIQKAFEVSMANPTTGMLRTSDGFELPYCSPAFLWSDDSKYLAVPQWRKSFWTGMRQHMVIVDVERRTARASRFSGWLLLPKAFERGRLEILTLESFGINRKWKKTPIVLRVPEDLEAFETLTTGYR